MSNFKNGETVRQSKGDLRYEDAATRVTISGFACAGCGRFYGDQEEMARGCCYSDAPCPDCGGRRSRHALRCKPCGDAATVKRWQAIEQDDVDTPFVLAQMDGDQFFFDPESLIDYCAEHKIKPSDMLLLNCKANHPPPFEMMEYLEDYIAEEGELPPGYEDAEKAVNEYLGRNMPLSWIANYKSRPTDDEIKQWDIEYAAEIADDGKIEACIPLIAAVYAKHVAGGSLHIVVDDNNTSDEDLAHCEQIGPSCEDWDVMKRCLDALKALNEDERSAAVQMYHMRRKTASPGL